MRARPRRTAIGPSTSPGNVELIRQRLTEGWAPPVARLLGFSLVEIDKGRARIDLRVGTQHANPMGSLHGGILCDIADAAMGMAYVSLISPLESFTTIELKMNFLRPFWTRTLSARGKILRKGRTMGLLECRITDEKRRLVAFATSTCVTIPGKPGESLTRPRRTSYEGLP